MREILFRAKRKDNGEWVNGSPFPPANACKMINAVALHPDFVEEEGPDGHVYYSEGWPVDTATVGQYTGVKDKTGRKIFEGDIISTPEYGVDSGKGVNFSGNDKFVVRYTDGAFFLENRLRRFYLRPDKKSEVVGNIYDNPEMMGGVKK